MRILFSLKNIDNVVPDGLKPETILYKKVIAGVMLDYQKKIKEAALAWKLVESRVLGFKLAFGTGLCAGL